MLALDRCERNDTLLARMRAWFRTRAPVRMETIHSGEDALRFVRSLARKCISTQDLANRIAVCARGASDDIYQRISRLHRASTALQDMENAALVILWNGMSAHAHDRIFVPVR